MNPASIVFRLLAALLVFSPAGFSQTNATQSKPGEQEQTIRISTDLIQVRAVVTDKQGRVIENLSKDDFIVLENTRPQAVAFFAADKIGDEMPRPSNGAAPADKSAPASSSAAPGETPSRTITLFVDTIHINAVRLARVKEVLTNFVDQQMTDRDLVAVVASGGRLGLLSVFTRDKNILRKAINSLAPWTANVNPSYLTPHVAGAVLRGDMQALAFAYEVVRFENQNPLTQPINLAAAPVEDATGKGLSREGARRYVMPYVLATIQQAAYLRRAALSTLESVLARMAELPGQRLLFLFSEGFTQAGTGGALDVDDVTPAVSRAARAGIVIHSIDVKGLEPLMVTADNPIFIQGSYLQMFMGESANDLRTGLRTLALDTAGEAIINTNNFEERLQKVMDQNRFSYVLSYYPPEEKDPRKFRNIIVQVKGHPEYIVRAQKGYRPADIEKTKAAKEKLTPRQKLILAMNSPLPATAFGISAVADYLEREGDEAQIAIQIFFDGDALQCKETDSTHLCEVEIATAIHEQSGKLVKAFNDPLRFELKPEQLTASKKNGYRYYKRINLKPGLYQIRAGLRESQTDRIGTSSLWVDVPELGKGKLQMSNLLFGAYPLVKETEAKMDGGVQALQPRVSRGVKAYRPSETLEYNYMVYPPSQQDSAADLMVQVEIIQSGKTVFQSAPASLESRMVARDKKGIAVAGELELNKVVPGLYELRVTVRNPKSKQVARQTTTFSVEK